jgi:hypothetical protein
MILQELLKLYQLTAPSFAPSPNLPAYGVPQGLLGSWYLTVKQVKGTIWKAPEPFVPVVNFPVFDFSKIYMRR